MRVYFPEKQVGFHYKNPHVFTVIIVFELDSGVEEARVTSSRQGILVCKLNLSARVESVKLEFNLDLGAVRKMMTGRSRGRS